MAFNRILDFSNGLDFYLGFFFSPSPIRSLYCPRSRISAGTLPPIKIKNYFWPIIATIMRNILTGILLLALSSAWCQKSPDNTSILLHQLNQAIEASPKYDAAKDKT